MRMVIDIPIDTHYHIKKRNVSESDIKIILEAISKGAPLLKREMQATEFLAEARACAEIDEDKLYRECVNPNNWIVRKEWYIWKLIYLKL